MISLVSAIIAQYALALIFGSGSATASFIVEFKGNNEECQYRLFLSGLIEGV